mmetsp:Transcript_96470/g.191108  ORF Transcript_96470/g.191108 Transcript_96470/m.191108 type:complete len:201 (-) Transcript_96470:512-1114(-)
MRPAREVQKSPSTIVSGTNVWPQKTSDFRTKPRDTMLPNVPVSRNSVCSGASSWLVRKVFLHSGSLPCETKAAVMKLVITTEKHQVAMNVTIMIQNVWRKASPISSAISRSGRKKRNTRNTRTALNALKARVIRRNCTPEGKSTALSGPKIHVSRIAMNTMMVSATSHPSCQILVEQPSSRMTISMRKIPVKTCSTCSII